MQQRRVRLGDVLDDYCPRERRITNHVVVAMIEDEVKRTRCSTCDAEHEYKEAKVPAPRRRKAGGVLSTDVPEGIIRPRPASAAVPDAPVDEGEPSLLDLEPPPPPVDSESAPIRADAVQTDTVQADTIPADTIQADTVHADTAKDEPPVGDEDDARHEWVHRPLIRATLPRPEGQAPERKAPDFTMRQPGRFANGRNNQRGGRRHGQGGMRQTQGQRQNSGPGQRHGSGEPPRHGSGHGPRHGSGSDHGNRTGSPNTQRGGRPPGNNRGGRKRGR